MTLETPNLHVSKTLNLENETRYRETENAIKARLEMLLCCVDMR